MLKNFFNLFCVFTIIMNLPTNYMLEAKVLVISVIGTKSHILHLQHIADELAERGHKVTFLAGEAVSQQLHPNFEYYLAPKSWNFSQNNFGLAPFNQNWLNQYPFIWLSHRNMAAKSCEIAYEEESVQKILSENTKYHAVIIDGIWNECFLPLAYHLKVPILLATGNSLNPTNTRALGIPTPFAYTPQFLYPVTSRMTFIERLRNSVAHFTFYAIHEWLYFPQIEAIARKFIGSTPPVLDILSNVSVIMVTADGMLTDHRPMMPFFVDIGGLHCRPAKILPKSLQTVISDSDENGFIIFSLGSMVESQFFPPNIMNSFIEAFSRLNQTIITRPLHYKGKFPKNIKMFSWLPQQDLLGHPKARLFITHGGMHGMHETIYHQIPIVGLGVFADQIPNLKRAVDRGIGLMLDPQNFTREAVFETIIKVLNDKSYKDNIRKLSKIFKDYTSSSLERAVYWTEYVIRHKGVEHLHSREKELNLFQYYIVDAVLLLLFAFYLLIYTAYIFFKVLKRCINNSISIKKQY